jgi:hypothetical protein
MKPPIAQSERGQSAVMVAVLLVALVGMLALVLDGGNAFFKRREAQNAADAGALAGAREWCNTQNATSAANRALEYAVTRNGATKADVKVSNGLVTVSATITMTPAFGAVFGVSELDPGGIATAGCFVPTAATGDVLPFAWACPTTSTDPDAESCAIPYNHPMVVMDSDKTGTQFPCQNPPGTLPGINCDPDGSGINEYVADGNRSWLNLDGGPTSNLALWINGGYNATINTHTWFGGQQGVNDSVFQAVGNNVGKTYVVPVFYYYCNLKGLPQSVCPSQWDTNDSPPGDTVVGQNGNVSYFYVTKFSLFHIDCVDEGGTIATVVPLSHGQCPEEWLVKHPTNPLFSNIKPSAKTIEGYFLQGTAPGLTGNGGGSGAGAYSLYLTR